MNLDQLKRGGFMGSLAEKMSKTTPGALSAAIDLILYDSVPPPAPAFPEMKCTQQRSIPAAVLCRPFDQPWKDAELQDTDRVLREAFHYLEACALREVAK